MAICPAPVAWHREDEKKMPILSAPAGTGRKISGNMAVVTVTYMSLPNGMKEKSNINTFPKEGRLKKATFEKSLDFINRFSLKFHIKKYYF